MATAPESGSAERHSSHISARMATTVFKPGVCTHFACGLIGGAMEEGAKGRQRVCVWAYPFLTSHSIHHFVAPAADKTTMWCISFEKST